MRWFLNYYPDASCARGIPKRIEDRKKDGNFLVSCDAECGFCGYIQHPPTGGKCPCCGNDGEIDYEKVRTL